MKIKIISIAFLFMLIFSTNAQYGIFTVSATNPPDFKTMSYEQASDAVNAESLNIVGSKTKRICPEYIANLTSEVEGGQLSDDNKVLAIYLLGELRPREIDSINALIKNIDFKASKIDPPARPIRWGQYPAAEALVKIGKPTIDPILTHLPKETSELRRQLMCDVIRQVLRRQQP